MRPIVILVIGIAGVSILGKVLPDHQVRVVVPLVATLVTLVVYRLIMRARARE
jgi:hypothetical protein